MSKRPVEVGRIFVAIELPQPIRAVLATAQSALLTHSGALKFVRQEQMHLTLRFLGDVPLDRFSFVEEAARVAGHGAAPFPLQLARMGTFASRGAARVVWVGVQDEGQDRLQHLFRSLEDQLAARGFSREPRPLSPHLTLARVHPNASIDEARAVQAAVTGLSGGQPLCGSFDVTALTVMRSDLVSSGPQYSALARCPLAPPV